MSRAPNSFVRWHTVNATTLQVGMERCHRPGKGLEDDIFRERDFLHDLMLLFTVKIAPKRWRTMIDEVLKHQARIDARVAEIVAERAEAMRVNPCEHSMCYVLGRHTAPCEKAEVSA